MKKPGPHSSILTSQKVKTDQTRQDRPDKTRQDNRPDKTRQQTRQDKTTDQTTYQTRQHTRQDNRPDKTRQQTRQDNRPDKTRQHEHNPHHCPSFPRDTMTQGLAADNPVNTKHITSSTSLHAHHYRTSP